MHQWMKRLTSARYVLLFQEENDIPSCDLSGFIRPSPVLVASPLSTFYRSSPKDGPIIPETQVINTTEAINRPISKANIHTFNKNSVVNEWFCHGKLSEGISIYRLLLCCIYFLTGNITNWHGLCTNQDRRALQRVIKTTQNIIAIHLPSISDIGKVRCLHRAQRILKDNTLPSHSPFSLLPSGKWYRSINCRTIRLQSSFFLQAVRLLSSSSAHHHN